MGTHYAPVVLEGEGVLLNRLWQECNFLNILLVMLMLLTGDIRF